MKGIRNISLWLYFQNGAKKNYIDIKNKKNVFFTIKSVRMQSLQAKKHTFFLKYSIKLAHSYFK